MLISIPLKRPKLYRDFIESKLTTAHGLYDLFGVIRRRACSVIHNIQKCSLSILVLIRWRGMEALNTLLTVPTEKEH